MRISDWSSDVCSSDLMLPPAGARFIVAESGANDPEFNLRREPALIQRVEGAADATFVSLLEPHGAYDAAAETVVASSARVAALEHRKAKAVALVLITLVHARRLALAFAHPTAADPTHTSPPHVPTITCTTHIPPP